MVCLRNICINTLHKGANDDDNNNVANVDLCHLFARSGLVSREVSLMVYSGNLYYNSKTKYLQRTLNYIRSVCANRWQGRIK